jgi:hypothetical protein
MLDLFEKWISCRLQRHFQNVALDVVEPAVIATPDSPLFDPAVFEGGSAVAAAEEEQAHFATAATKGNQIFSEDPDSFG